MKKKKKQKLNLSYQTVRKLATEDLEHIAGAGPSDNCSGNPCSVNTCLCTILCSIRTCPP